MILNNYWLQWVPLVASEVLRAFLSFLVKAAVIHERRCVGFLIPMGGKSLVQKEGDWDNTTCRRTKDRKIPERVSVFITSSDESAQRATSDENWYKFRDFLVLKWCRHVVLPILLLQNSVKMASQIHCERTENIAQRTLYCNMLDCKILKYFLVFWFFFENLQETSMRGSCIIILNGDSNF